MWRKNLRRKEWLSSRIEEVSRIHTNVAVFWFEHLRASVYISEMHDWVDSSEEWTIQPSTSLRDQLRNLYGREVSSSLWKRSSRHEDCLPLQEHLWLPLQIWQSGVSKQSFASKRVPNTKYDLCKSNNPRSVSRQRLKVNARRANLPSARYILAVWEMAESHRCSENKREKNKI